MDSSLMIGIGVLVLGQLTLQVIALVQLVRTPAERVSIGGRKWVWAIIIIFGEVLGAILWFVLGRKATPALDATPPADAAVKQDAVDALYGGPKQS